MRNKTRTLLTFGAIQLSIALVCVLRAMPLAFDSILDDLANDTRISVHHSAGVTYPMPYSYLTRIRKVPGVVDAVSWTWFGGAIDSDKGVTIPNFAVDPESLAVVYSDAGIDPEELVAFRNTRIGALVGVRALEPSGWRIGDTITLQSTVFPVTVEVEIVGTVPGRKIRDPHDQEGAPVIYFHRAYLEEALGDLGIPFAEAGTIWARVDDPDMVAAVLLEIQDLFRNSSDPVVSETERTFFLGFFSQVQGLLAVIQGVAILVTASVIFIVVNTASMTIRERLREIGILRTIGFGQTLIFWLLLSETTIMSTTAGIFGVLTSVFMTELLAKSGGSIPSIGSLAVFVITDQLVLQGVLLGFAIGIAAGLLPAYQATRKPPTETIRELF